MFESSLLGYLFIGFFAAIIVCQLVPAVLLFAGMIKGVCSPRTSSVSSR